MENSKHLYQVGDYRLWLNTETGALQMKLDGNRELYNIPKNTKLYDRLLNDFFSKPVEQGNK
ncbi:hypothetical protein [Bacillus pseudomycoides]|uniref:hypothetical protein n=1 Tax=Bacillus pseudomycoides TaxID=64104 RepID=UPI000BF14672|nr:hypothetical protein [Bacillus pseudomycoides]PEI98668.1 hypothetical protein CN686_04665 [Bacillus pseudomycoides]PEM77451.1 hypothetical protein CN619_05240 [Bacillus pseudomycoides]PGA64083.1 hypothetical protein COL84_05125 [Bacillus pseudomycoides]PHA49681.1 hypothetical protein COE73_12390 [Bacillus pseudomycoides]PHA65367.1 hypothetical protein COE76_04755 [Bacillus pseudomycoides]